MYAEKGKGEAFLQRFNAKQFRQLDDRSSITLPARLMILSFSLLLDPSRFGVTLWCIIFSDQAARSGLLRKEKAKRPTHVPFCPLYVYYDDSGRSVDVR
jgi:hypothetical protein